MAHLKTVQCLVSAIVQAFHLFISFIIRSKFKMAVKTRGAKTRATPQTKIHKYDLRNHTKKQKRKVQALSNKNQRANVKLKKTKLIKKAPKIIKKTSKHDQKINKVVSIINRELRLLVSISKNKKSTKKSLPKKLNIKSLPRNRVRKCTDNTFMAVLLSSSKLKCEKDKKLPKSLAKANIQNVQMLNDKQPIISKPQNKIILRKHANSMSKPKQKPKMIKRQFNFKLAVAQAAPPLRLLKQIPKVSVPKRFKTDKFDENIKNVPKLDQQAKMQQIVLFPRNLQDRKNVEDNGQCKKKQQQRIFLLNLTKKQDEWNIFVTRIAQKKRIVRINSQLIACSCINYRLNRKTCGDIDFVFRKILHNDEVLAHLKFKTEIHEFLYDTINRQIQQLLSFHLDSKESTINPMLQKMCLICFNKLEEDKQSLEKCENCQQQFHSQCFHIFSRFQRKCPKCKALITVIKQELTEPIEELGQLKI